MKKTILRIFIAIILLISTSGALLLTAHAQEFTSPANDSLPPLEEILGIDFKQNDSTSSASKKPTCGEILKDSVVSPKQKEKLPPINKNDIIVILSESIASNNSLFSCGEIVTCLRKVPKIRDGDTETLMTEVLIREYPFCIVAGKDGLDLLSNYANLVYTWIAGIVGAICILVIILSGIQISIGGLSQEEVSSAKDRVGRALLGLAVLFLSAFILYTINPFFFT